MSTRELKRKVLFVSENVHKLVTAMQERLEEQSQERPFAGYRVTQSEAVKRGMEALEREIEASK